MDTTRRQNKPAVKAQKAAEKPVMSSPMLDVTPELSLRVEKPADIVMQDNAPKAEVLDANDSQAGVFPVISSSLFEEKYSRTKVIEEVSKPIVMKDLETVVDNLATKLRFDLPTELNIICCRVVLGTIIHGNIWPARKLLQALGQAPKGSSKTMFRVSALKDWLIAKGPFQPWQDVGDMFDYTIGKAVENAKGLLIDGDRKRKMLAAYTKDSVTFIRELVETPFWIFKPEAEDGITKFDFRKELGKLLQRAAKMEQRLGEHKKGDEIFLEGLTQVRKYLPQINAGQQTVDPPANVN